jgi:hypothetical protein
MIPPASITFAEMVELRRQVEAGLLVEGRDYDVVEVDEATARDCFKPGALKGSNYADEIESRDLLQKQAVKNLNNL